MKLFSEEIIGAGTKNDVLRKVGQQGADALLDHMETKIEAKPERLELVLQIMESEESLRDIVGDIRKGSVLLPCNIQCITSYILGIIIARVVCSLFYYKSWVGVIFCY